MRTYYMGKSMPKAGLMKLIAVRPNLAGRYAPLYDEIALDAPTDYLFTGQRWEQELGLYWYGSRFYDPYLSRFIQPDSIVPNIFYPPAFDRFSYSYNSPIRYSDPSGHGACDNSKYAEDLCGSTHPKNTNKPRRVPGPKFLGNAFKYKRVEIPDITIEDIAAVIFSETNGDYPVDMTIRMIWVEFNRYSAQMAGEVISIYTGALVYLKDRLHDSYGIVLKSADQDLAGISRELVSLYKGKNSKFDQILALVKDVYLNAWKGGAPDPTNGSKYFSVADDLERENADGLVVNKFTNHEILYHWLVNNFFYHYGKNLSYTISEPFFWRENELGILVTGSEACIWKSSCGAR